MDLDDYQAKAHESDESKRTTISLYGLVGEVGSIFSVFKKRLRDKASPAIVREELIEELGDALWYIANIASLSGIKFSEVADANLSKIRAFSEHIVPQDYDANFPETERFPRHFRVTFMVDPDTARSQMLLNGEPFGDPLSDNAHDEDYYRFHDAFHWAFLAHLHWSPVLRKLMRRKRKSDPNIDEKEDGARAAITEEAISAVIFNVAEDHDFFPDPKSIPNSLLKTVRRLASKYEVRSAGFKQWQQAIYTGCSIYRQLVQNKGGVIEVDLDEGRVEFVACPIA